jgi:DNA polymerase III delta prime subunit
MTKNAQQALRYLLQNYSTSVRFCLICNYISRIDEGLQNEFLRLRFNQLPKEDIINFLKNISTQEELKMNIQTLSCVQQLFKSDIRSMINFMQSNQNILDSKFNIIDDNIWESLCVKIIENKDLRELNKYIQHISNNYNIDKKNIIKDFFNFIIRKKSNIISDKFLNFIENIMHFQDCKNIYYINYSLLNMRSFLLSVS